MTCIFILLEFYHLIHLPSILSVIHQEFLNLHVEYWHRRKLWNGERPIMLPKVRQHMMKNVIGDNLLFFFTFENSTKSIYLVFNLINSFVLGKYKLCWFWYQQQVSNKLEQKQRKTQKVVQCSKIIFVKHFISKQAHR